MLFSPIVDMQEQKYGEKLLQEQLLKRSNNSKSVSEQHYKVQVFSRDESIMVGV